MSLPNRSLHKLPLPPYGRELAEARRRGKYPNVFIHAGVRAWDRAKMRMAPEVLCCDGEFRQYDWTVCKGLSVTLVVWGEDPDWVDSFAQLLVRSGAQLVCALNAHEGDGGQVESCFYRPRPR
jgi:hypothetical protein